MKTEEAIQELEYILVGHPETSRRGQAVLMAIEALKQPEIVRCKDCEHAKSVNDRWIRCSLTCKYEINTWYCDSAKRREE